MWGTRRDNGTFHCSCDGRWPRLIWILRVIQISKDHRACRPETCTTYDPNLAFPAEVQLSSLVSTVKLATFGISIAYISFCTYQSSDFMQASSVKCAPVRAYDYRRDRSTIESVNVGDVTWRSSRLCSQENSMNKEVHHQEIKHECSRSGGLHAYPDHFREPEETL